MGNLTAKQVKAIISKKIPNPAYLLVERAKVMFKEYCEAKNIPIPERLEMSVREQENGIMDVTFDNRYSYSFDKKTMQLE